MGALLNLFGCKPKTKEEHTFSEEFERKDIKPIKIHICGNGERKKKVIDLLFKSKITRPDLKGKGDTEYKSSDFYWITKIYKDEILTTEKCKEIDDIIEKDKTDEDNPLNFHIMLLFGDDNDIQMILEEFSLINRPRIIFITESQKEIKKSNNKKFVTNIICEEMNDKELNSYIVSTLWELDCYYNEKGNEIFRHTPVNIAKGLKTDMSFFSINILLTGMCRAGKSTFINLISGKFVALETNDTDSVTLKFSEYYIYKDDKKDHGAIKLIDTPGISDDDEINEQTFETIKDYIKNKDQKIRKQLHFILFFFMEQTPLGSARQLLKLLNDSNYPVFFIINKSLDKTWKGKSQDIKSKISFLKKKGCERLAKVDNFIQVNIKSSDNCLFYGVDDIFKKIENYIYDNNLLDKKLFEQMLNLQENSNEEIQDKSLIDNIDKLKENLKNNLLFKNINIENIKAHGRKIAKKYEKNIILLSNLKNVFPETLNNIPIISFLQAFMIKEIGAGYGFDFNSVNDCFKKFEKDINNLNFQEIKESKYKKTDKIKLYKKEDIHNQKDELNSTINEIWKSSNKEVIEKLVNRIHELTLKGKNKISDENAFNIENTKAISKLCQIYFEKEIDSSHGLPFFIYYYKQNESLMKDIKYYAEKKDWEKDEMEIKEKKIDLFKDI